MNRTVLFCKNGSAMSDSFVARVFFLFVLSIVTVAPKSTASGQGDKAASGIIKLQEIVDSLNKETGNVIDIPSIERSKSLAVILNTDSELLWTQLLRNESPIAQVAGLLCFKLKRPDCMQLQAVRAILVSDRPASPHLGLAAAILAEPVKTPKDIDDIAAMLGFSDAKWKNLVVLMAAIHKESLPAIFERLNVQCCTELTVAAIVGELASIDQNKLNDGLKNKLRAAIRKLEFVDGPVRCVYLAVIDPIPENFVEMLDSVLIDKSVDDMSILSLLLIRGREHVEHLSTMLPVLENPRKALVQKYIDRIKKKK